MKVYEFDAYRLMLSHDPCEIFRYFKVEAMHGLNLQDCREYPNTTEDAYIAGWCNYSPTDNKLFVFINLSRCADDIRTTGLVFHEMMHLSCHLFNCRKYEEMMITHAENQTYLAVKLIKELL